MTVDYLVPWLNASGQGGLRNSMLVAAGDGVTTMYSINFAGGYIDKGNIKAYTFDPVTGNTTPVTITAGMWTGANQITLTSPVAIGQFIVIYRDTPKGQPLVNFVNGAIMNEPNLDLMAEQSVFIAAEMADRFDLLNDGSTLAIQNSAEALSTANTALAQSASAVDTAAATISTANAAQTAAGQAVTTANTARDTANAIDGKAQSALDASAAAVSTANSASSTANGIDGKAQSALDASANAVSTANAASTTAGNAVTTANTAKSTADGLASSISTANTNASNAVSTANGAQTTANAAMPKSGGTFTGDVSMGTKALTVGNVKATRTTVPAAGEIGEFVSAGPFGATGWANSTFAARGSLQLGPGVWDVDAIMAIGQTGGASISNQVCGISTTSNAVDTLYYNQVWTSSAGGGGGGVTPAPRRRYVVASGTLTVYVICYAAFSGGTGQTCDARIEARRVA